MKPKLIASTLSLLVVFGLSGCYAVPGDSDGSYGVPDRDHNHHRGDEQPPYYNTPPPPPGPNATYSPPPRARERVPSYVSPPQQNPKPTPKQPAQPRVREQSPTPPPPKAPTPRTRPGSVSYNAGSRGSAIQRSQM